MAIKVEVGSGYKKPIKVKKPGKLHRELGVPADKNIPMSKAMAAMSKKGAVGQDARYFVNVLRKGARTMKKKAKKKK